MNARFDRRQFLRTLGFGAAACAMARLGLCEEKPARTPNIMIILADDLGYGDVACYNPESKVPTPNLDKLAAEGIRFTDAHSPSTVCTPTRYSLLTGQMAFRIGAGGVFTGVGGPCLIEEGRLTLPQMLREMDYIVGELMETLERLGVADNTLVMFSSDNGPEVPTVVAMRRDHKHDGARLWRGMKRDQWEGGHRVPFIARWPGQLYNLQTDPGETTNLYYKYPNIVKELKSLLETSKQSGRSTPLDRTFAY